MPQSSLEQIHNGNEAMNAFPDLHKQPSEELAKICAAFLALQV